jgi:hypothetical protein
MSRSTVYELVVFDHRYEGIFCFYEIKLMMKCWLAFAHVSDSGASSYLMDYNSWVLGSLEHRSNVYHLRHRCYLFYGVWSLIVCRRLLSDRMWKKTLPMTCCRPMYVFRARAAFRCTQKPRFRAQCNHGIGYVCIVHIMETICGSRTRHGTRVTMTGPEISVSWRRTESTTVAYNWKIAWHLRQRSSLPDGNAWK